MTTKHTPTPWRVDPNYPCDIQDQSGKTEVGWIYAREIPGLESVVGQLSAPPPDEAIANCAFIVRAVNHHEALVEALNNVIRYVDEDDDDDMNALMDQHEAAYKLLISLNANTDA